MPVFPYFSSYPSHQFLCLESLVKHDRLPDQFVVEGEG